MMFFFLFFKFYFIFEFYIIVLVLYYLSFNPHNTLESRSDYLHLMNEGESLGGCGDTHEVIVAHGVPNPRVQYLCS